MSERLPAPPMPDWLADQVPFERYTLELDDGLHMHVMEHGEGRPVVMFHGNPTWGYLYRKVATELADEPLRLIMPDMIGLGFSDRPYSVEDHNLRNHSKWMVSAMGQMDLDDAVAVVQDWGGSIGVHSMSQYPGLMTGLVVLNTVIGPPKPGFKPTTFHRILSSKAGDFIPWQHNLWFAQGDRSSIRGVVQRSYSFPLSKAQGGGEAPRALIRAVPDSMEHENVEPLHEVAAAVEAYNGPSSIVWGSKDPILGKILRRINRALPDAEVTETDAGHFIQEERPVEIADAVRSVVARS